MVAGRKQFAWVVACATLFAPSVPQACCCPSAEPAAICHEPCCDSGAADDTCSCQLDARQAETALPAKAASPSVDSPDQGVAPAAVVVPVPQVLGVSREYVAASLAVPIRPPRILFGVWRD